MNFMIAIRLRIFVYAVFGHTFSPDEVCEMTASGAVQGRPTLSWTTE